MSMKILDYDGNEVFPTVKNVYKVSTDAMHLGTLAAGSVILDFANPTGSGKTIYITKIQTVTGFVGTGAATWVGCRFIRATGTSAAGTGTIVGAAIPPRLATQTAAVATLRIGPVAITGMSTSGNNITNVSINHQVGSGMTSDLIFVPHDQFLKDGIQLAAGTSLICSTLNNASVNGTLITINLEWIEIPTPA